MGSEVKYGIITKAIADMYGGADKTEAKDGTVLSAISDQMLFGMLLKITGNAENGFYPVRSFYGYDGYMEPDAFIVLGEIDAKKYEESSLYVTNAFFVDIMSVPKVQGVCLAGLYRGSVVQVLSWESEKEGWVKVKLPDGKEGYIRNQFLSEKKFSQAGIFEDVLIQRTVTDEAQFRKDVVNTAKLYMGIQYRWGGRCTAGLDCSGLTSESYLLNGIITYRDARIVPGFPVHEIPKESMKPGDLMYFPGHIAMYIGDKMYIHSTGKIGSGGVVINSFDTESELFRPDLLESWYATGSIFGAV